MDCEHHKPLWTWIVHLTHQQQTEQCLLLGRGFSHQQQHRQLDRRRRVPHWEVDTANGSSASRFGWPRLGSWVPIEKLGDTASSATKAPTAQRHIVSIRGQNSLLERIFLKTIISLEVVSCKLFFNNFLPTILKLNFSKMNLSFFFLNFSINNHHKTSFV